jgi:outer membrane protein, heavy metal efflux system
LTRVGALGLVLLIVVPTRTVFAQQPSAPIPPPTLTLQSALERALSANPRLAAVRLRRAVNVASRDVAAERLNPEFRAEFAKETPKEGYTLAIPLETGGKRAKRVALGDATIATGDAELTQAIAEVQADVRRAYFARATAESRLALLQDMQQLAQRARDAAQARFDTGDAPRLEVLQAQLTLADAENQARAARGAVEASRVSLNALLGLPLDTATVIAPAPEGGPPLAVDAAMARARASNTELVLLDRRLSEQQARLALVHALRQPDVTPEATLTRRAEPEFSTGWRAAVAITIPILTTHAAGVHVEEAALAQLTSEREAARQRISGAVAAAAAVADAQREQFARYRDEIVPQALEVERMAEDSYRLGQTGISAYLQALQSTRDVRLRAIESAADLQNALADLEQAIGAPLTSAP